MTQGADFISGDAYAGQRQRPRRNTLRPHGDFACAVLQVLMRGGECFLFVSLHHGYRCAMVYVTTALLNHALVDADIQSVVAIFVRCALASLDELSDHLYGRAGDSARLEAL